MNKRYKKYKTSQSEEDIQARYSTAINRDLLYNLIQKSLIQILGGHKAKCCMIAYHLTSNLLDSGLVKVDNKLSGD